jgi:hypothetical protein
MSWTYQIEKKHSLVITTVWDALDGDQVLEHQRRLRSDRDFNPDFYQFLDFTRVTEINIDLPTVVALSDIDLFSGNSRRAWVTGSNILAYGMCRMFIAFRRATPKEEMRAFTNRDEALEWLFHGSRMAGQYPKSGLALIAGHCSANALAHPSATVIHMTCSR